MSDFIDSCPVKIAVRERPMPINGSSSLSVVKYHSNIIVVDERPFAFDHVLGPEVAQEELFDEVIKPLVGKVKNGFNCTALAYGQTGTGKTYTMGLNSNSFEDDHVGVIPRCLRELLDSNANEEMPTTQHEICVSFIEIYSEKVYDLLSENNAESIAARGYKYTGGTRHPITNIEECYNILTKGNKNRHVRPTVMNTQSSRSHAIFTIHIRSTHDEQTTCSSLNLVDLAGSEGVRRTGHQGVAMSEGVHINQGLLCIGKVMQAMTQGNKVIPYRDSVLSSVLQDSLNPNSYLTLLACISPSGEDLSETLSTLRFAQNAKLLKNTPHMNTIMAEIKKNKVKTPYKRSILQIKNIPTSIPNKRPYSNLPMGPHSGVKKSIYHSNTFSTPSKLKQSDANKFNQTEMGLTPKEKQKAQIILKRPMIPKPPLPPTAQAYPFDMTNRSSLFDHTIDSRASLMSLNISTSTALDGPTTKSTSYSPVVRKCFAEFETVMENKMLQMIETLKSTNKENGRHHDSHVVPTVPSTPAHSEKSMQFFPSSIRQELKSIMQEILADNAEQPTNKDASSLSITPNAKCQLFATSSPVFKIPDVPLTNGKTNNLSLQLSIDSSIDLTQDDQSNAFKDTYFAEETVMSKPLRRSRRISQNTLNESMARTEVPLLNTSQRRRSTRKSVKQLNDERRRSIRRLSTHSEAPDAGEEVEAKVKPKKPTKSLARKKPTIELNNSVIASYFDAGSEKSFKKINMAKHRKAILELLNTGSMKELQVLPTIGQKTAYQLVTQRVLNGKFKTITQVEKLPIWRGTSWERFAQANILQ